MSKRERWSIAGVSGILTNLPESCQLGGDCPEWKVAGEVNRESQKGRKRETLGRISESDLRTPRLPFRAFDFSGFRDLLADWLPSIRSAHKKAPENNRSEGGCGRRGFRERLDGAAHILVRRAVYDRQLPALPPASMPASCRAARRDALA